MINDDDYSTAVNDISCLHDVDLIGRRRRLLFCCTPAFGLLLCEVGGGFFGLLPVHVGKGPYAAPPSPPHSANISYNPSKA